MDILKFINDNQGLVSLAGILVTLAGFILVYFQIRQAKFSIFQSATSSIYGLSSQFYLHLSSNSELRPYFYDGKRVCDSKKDQLFPLCEYMADLFEYILVQGNGLDKEIGNSWRDYFMFVSRNSPVFSDYINSHRFYYSEKFLRDFDDAKKVEELDLSKEGFESKTLGEKLTFVDNLFLSKKQICSNRDALKLIQIIENEKNGIIAHDIVFLIGEIQNKMTSGDSDEQVAGLISIFRDTDSVVLKHEIVESLGNFQGEKTLKFLEEQKESSDRDISQTAEIALVKLKYQRKQMAT